MPRWGVVATIRVRGRGGGIGVEVVVGGGGGVGIVCGRGGGEEGEGWVFGFLGLVFFIYKAIDVYVLRW